MLSSDVITSSLSLPAVDSRCAGDRDRVLSAESEEGVRGFRSVSEWAPKGEKGQRAVSVARNEGLSADEEDPGGLFWFGVKAVRVPSLFSLYAGRFWGTDLWLELLCACATCARAARLLTRRVCASVSVCVSLCVPCVTVCRASLLLNPFTTTSNKRAT